MQETVHRTLMRLYARQGRRGAALKQYQVCVGALQRAQEAFELGLPLFRGQLAQDLPEGLRRWLAAKGLLAG